MSPSHFAAHVLMAVFALGVLGCVITVPLCAYKFFRVLVEKDVADEETAAEATTAQPTTASASGRIAATPAPTASGGQPPPQARASNPAGVIPVHRPDHPRQHRIIPKRNRRPRGTDGK